MSDHIKLYGEDECPSHQTTYNVKHHCSFLCESSRNTSLLRQSNDLNYHTGRFALYHKAAQPESRHSKTLFGSRRSVDVCRVWYPVKKTVPILPNNPVVGKDTTHCIRKLSCCSVIKTSSKIFMKKPAQESPGRRKAMKTAQRKPKNQKSSPCCVWLPLTVIVIGLSGKPWKPLAHTWSF